MDSPPVTRCRRQGLQGQAGTDPQVDSQLLWGQPEVPKSTWTEGFAGPAHPQGACSVHLQDDVWVLASPPDPGPPGSGTAGPGRPGVRTALRGGNNVFSRGRPGTILPRAARPWVAASRRLAASVGSVCMSSGSADARAPGDRGRVPGPGPRDGAHRPVSSLGRAVSARSEGSSDPGLTEPLRLRAGAGEKPQWPGVVTSPAPVWRSNVRGHAAQGAAPGQTTPLRGAGSWGLRPPVLTAPLPHAP